MDMDPGKVQNMNGGKNHLLAAIIQKTSGMTPLAFANKYLFQQSVSDFRCGMVGGSPGH